MNYISPVEFPTLPNDIVDAVYAFVEDNRAKMVDSPNIPNFKLTEVERAIFKRSGKKDNPDNIGYKEGEVLKEGACQFTFMRVGNSPINKWVEENIKLEGDSVIHIHILEMYNGSFYFPHVDPVRTQVYNYVIETGGDDTETAFWKPKAEFNHMEVVPQVPIPYERIDKVHSYKMPLQQWHHLAVSNIHSIEHVDPTKRRLILSISTIR